MEVTQEQINHLRRDLEIKIDSAVLHMDKSMKEHIASLKNDLFSHVKSDDERFKNVDLKFETKVPYTVFTWVFGIAMLIVISLFGIIWAELQSVSESTHQTRESTVRLETQWNLRSKE